MTFLTMNLSRRRKRTGVMKIGLKSHGTMDHRTGSMMEPFNWAGTCDWARNRLKRSASKLQKEGSQPQIPSGQFIEDSSGMMEMIK